MSRNKLTAPVDLSGWELPKTIDYKFSDVIDRAVSKIEKEIEKLRYELDAAYYIKKAAAEALSYAIKDDARINFPFDGKPGDIDICLPLGNMEGATANWSVNLKREAELYAIYHAYKGVNDEEKRIKYFAVVKMFRECADILDRQYKKEVKRRKRL